MILLTKNREKIETNNTMEVVLMDEKYEYHKQNDYPGERIAERKRVADRAEEADMKFDARVAEKGRKHDVQMNSEIQRSTNRATRASRRRDSADAIGLAVLAGLIVVMLAGSVWGFVSIQKQSSEIDALNSQLDRANYELSVSNGQIIEDADADTDIIYNMAPIRSVSPSNNEVGVSVYSPISVVFSEDMDSSTINKNTFIVEQRTTPEQGSDAESYRSLQIEGIVTYSNRKATFTPNERLYPNQVYGNVFTVTITDEVEDIVGNSLVKDYIWSFTTGGDPFNTGATTSMQG